MRRFLSVFLLFCCAFTVLSQTSRKLERLDVVVTDAAGKAVTTLSKESFELLEDGQPRPIEIFAPVDTPWNFVLLFDKTVAWPLTASTFLRPDALDSVWAQGINRFIAQLAPQDRVTIATFENKVDTLLDWRNARTGRAQDVVMKPLIQGSDGIKDLHGALEWAIGKLRGVQGRKAVILLTDGRDGRLAPQWLINDDRQEIFDPLFGVADVAEGEDFLKTLTQIKTSDVRLLFLALNTTRPPEFHGRPISGVYPGSKEAIASYLSRVRLRIEKMAEASGGHVLYGNSISDALAEYGRLHDHFQLGARYTLEFSSSGNSDELQPRIEIRLRDPGLKVRFIKAVR
jgi:VWFA-related protein